MQLLAPKSEARAKDSRISRTSGSNCQTWKRNPVNHPREKHLMVVSRLGGFFLLKKLPVRAVFNGKNYSVECQRILLMLFLMVSYLVFSTFERAVNTCCPSDSLFLPLARNAHHGNFTLTCCSASISTVAVAAIGMNPNSLTVCLTVVFIFPKLSDTDSVGIPSACIPSSKISATSARFSSGTSSASSPLP